MKALAAIVATIIRTSRIRARSDCSRGISAAPGSLDAKRNDDEGEPRAKFEQGKSESRGWAESSRLRNARRAGERHDHAD
jgi:hypothetical protein